MLRRIAPVLALALGCSAKGPSGTPPVATQPTPPRTVDEPAAAPTAAPLDPREATLATTVLHLLEEDHLLRKRIDDSVSRVAFATYLDRLDGSKMFLLRGDQD